MPCFLKTKSKKNGFTLIEMSFVVAMILVLLLISLVALFSLREKSYLGNNTQGVVDVLRLARNKSIASERSANYGVHFDTASSPNRYILFKSQRGTSDDIIFELSRQVNFQEINLTSDDVIFSRVSGSVIIGTGNVKLRLISDPLQTTTIYIDSSGKISLLPTSVFSLPVKDFRHVHFNLVWSIQGAANLKFYFPNKTLPTQTETIPMASYFENNNTEFDWSGSFTVPTTGGSEQKFRVHTHSLDAFNTTLSITRDRNNGKNDKEVTIYIDMGVIEKEIAHYYVDGTVDKGFDVDTMENQ